MLCFCVLFSALTAIERWNPLFVLQAAVCPMDNSHAACPFIYPSHGYQDMVTCSMYDSFPSLELHLYCVAAGQQTHNTGHKTHNIGCTTHNTAGRVTQSTSYALSIQGTYCLMSGCMAGNLISVSTTGYGLTDKSPCLCCGCHQVIDVSTQCNLSEKTNNHINVFKQPCSKSATISVYALPHKHCSNSQPEFNQRPHKHYKWLALCLLAICVNNSIHYVFNGSSCFNQVL